jgi:hypothetical protein
MGPLSRTVQGSDVARQPVVLNAEVVRRAKAEIGADVSREAILEAVREARGE